MDPCHSRQHTWGRKATECHREPRPSLRMSDFWTRRTGPKPRDAISSLSWAADWLRWSRDGERDPWIEPSQPAGKSSEDWRQPCERMFQSSGGNFEPAEDCRESSEPWRQPSEPTPEGSNDMGAYRSADRFWLPNPRPNSPDGAVSRFRTGTRRPISERDGADAGTRSHVRNRKCSKVGRMAGAPRSWFPRPTPSPPWATSLRYTLLREVRDVQMDSA
jgi:hypothetical protein